MDLASFGYPGEVRVCDDCYEECCSAAPANL